MARVNEDETRIARRIFEECYEDLVSKIDLDILYADLKSQCELNCLQLSKVYILRGGETPEIQTVFNLIAAEEDEELVKWLDAIQTSLSNTSNQKCGHGTILDKMIQIRQQFTGTSSTTSTAAIGRSKRPKPKSVPKRMRASTSVQGAVVRQRQYSPLFSPVSLFHFFLLVKSKDFEVRNARTRLYQSPPFPSSFKAFMPGILQGQLGN